MLKSTVHRVTFSGGEERYSMAYFCHPLDEVKLEAVPSKTIEEYGAQGKEEMKRQRKNVGLDDESGEVLPTLTAKGHLERRLKVTHELKE
jgi:isopenicillin N synthase-like dioxygenase